MRCAMVASLPASGGATIARHVVASAHSSCWYSASITTAPASAPASPCRRAPPAAARTTRRPPPRRPRKGRGAAPRAGQQEAEARELFERRSLTGDRLVAAPRAAQQEAEARELFERRSLTGDRHAAALDAHRQRRAREPVERHHGQVVIHPSSSPRYAAEFFSV